MKKHRFLLIGFSSFCLLSACSKKNSGPEGIETLQGTWEIRQSFSGMMPLTNYPAGNGSTVSFDSTNFVYHRNGQVVHQGVYQLKNDSTTDVNSCALLPPKNSSPNVIIFGTNQTGHKTSFEITGNTLKLSSGCIPADGGWTIYKKISEHQNK